MKTRYLKIAFAAIWCLSPWSVTQLLTDGATDAGMLRAATPKAAQPGRSGISEQVEVTREYNPDLDRNIRKLDVKPQMVDTTTLKPDFEYSIRPTGYIEAFDIPALQPVRINVENYRYLTPYYLKLGVGWPGNGVLDLYFTERNDSKLTYGAYINHLGQYCKAPTDFGNKLSAFDMRNAAGAFVGKQFGRYDLRVAMDANYDIYDSYGIFSIADLPLSDYGKSERINYKGIRAGAEFGNDFSDLSRFSFRVGGDVDIFANKLNTWDNRIGAFAQVGKAFGAQSLTLRGEVCKYFGYKDATCLTVSPRYLLKIDKFNAGLGANIAFEREKTWFFPIFTLDYEIAGKYFVPFIEIDGSFKHGDMRLTAKQNPFVEDGLLVGDMGQYNFKGGIMGSFSDMTSYKIFAAANFYRGMSFFVNDYDEGTTSRFMTVTDNCAAYTLGASLEFLLSEYFDIRASGGINTYHLDLYEKAGGLPGYNFAVGANWNISHKWTVGLSGNLLGTRYFYEQAASEAGIRYNKVDPVFDLGAKLGYRYSRFAAFWLEGSNLTNSRLYPWNHYRSIGTGVMGGITLSF